MDAQVQFLKALADPTRLTLLKLIMADEMCVCELQEILQISQSAVSQHMTKLKAAGLVSERRSSQWTYYRADARRVLGALAETGAFLAADLPDSPGLAATADRVQTLRRVQPCLQPEGIA